MPRTPLFRSFSALLSLWFAFGLVESAALHVCPMHDGGLARVAASIVPASGGGAHGDHALPSDAPGGEGAHSCTCMGACGVAAVIATPVVRIGDVPTVVADGRPPVLRSRVTVRSASSYLFPPATAPPALRVG